MPWGGAQGWSKLSPCPFQPFRGRDRILNEEPVVRPLPGDGGPSGPGEAALQGRPGPWGWGLPENRNGGTGSLEALLPHRAL